MPGPAFVSSHLSGESVSDSSGTLFHIMSSDAAAHLFTIAAAGELVADKLPIVPDRVSPGPLAGRILSGAVCGAVICEAEGERADIGAVVGGLAAIGSAFAFYHIRRRIAEAEVVPGAIVGLAEDALVIALGFNVLKPKAD
jgi:uncharacterized membrane protein